MITYLCKMAGNHVFGSLYSQVRAISEVLFTAGSSERNHPRDSLQEVVKEITQGFSPHSLI